MEDEEDGVCQLIVHDEVITLVSIRLITLKWLPVPLLWLQAAALLLQLRPAAAGTFPVAMRMIAADIGSNHQ